MKRITFALPFLFLALPAHAWDQQPNNPITACGGDLPHGVPVSDKKNTVLRCTTGYALLHDNDARISPWAAWTVTPDETVGCHPRDDAFQGDQALPKGQRAEPGDYNKSGYDKGHMVPDADLSWSKISEKESFLMSNMSPQLPNLNRGAWKNLEATTRAWAWGRKHNLTVYSGNIYKTGTSKTIGENKVVVPEHLYKIVIDNNTGEVLAFLFPNVDKKDVELKSLLTSVSAIEAASGVIFPLPKGADKSAVAKDIWPASIGDAMSAKKATCRVNIKK